MWIIGSFGVCRSWSRRFDPLSVIMWKKCRTSLGVVGRGSRSRVQSCLDSVSHGGRSRTVPSGQVDPSRH